MKRLFDILFSLFGLIIFAPVLVLIVVLIKLTSSGPVVYRGKRVGYQGKLFEILKFRTMVVGADKLGASSTAQDDPRITSVGRFLRRYKLDELPQLINVLRGDMSFVGPRPQVEWAVQLYSQSEKTLLTVRPGITDYASLVFRNEGEILAGSTNPDQDYLEKIAPRKIQLGLEYVRRHSIWTDTKIILATALGIVGINPLWCLSSAAREIAQQQVNIKHELST